MAITKKLILLPLLVAAVLAVSGCVRGQSGQAAGRLTQEDLVLTVDEVHYGLGVDIQRVIAHLGDGYAYAEGKSCDYDGLDKTYTYSMAVFYTNPLAEGDLINEIYTRSPGVTTARGIAVSDTKEAVLSAYGEDCEDAGDLLIYRLEEQRAALCFELEDQTVAAVYITNQPV